MKSKWLLPIFLVLFAAGLIAALLVFQNHISLVSGLPTETITPSETSFPFPGDGEWILVSLNGKDVIPGAPITMTITKDNHYQIYWLSGLTGCNKYSYGVYLNDQQMTPEDIPEVGGAVTQMLCSGPEGVMEQEKEFLDTLTSANRIFLSGSNLELKMQAGITVVLVFQRP